MANHAPASGAITLFPQRRFNVKLPTESHFSQRQMAFILIILLVSTNALRAKKPEEQHYNSRDTQTTPPGGTRRVWPVDVLRHTGL
jgi:hypothetical protein